MMEFPPFRLDTINECLWRHSEDGVDARIRLTPKAFAVLRYLVEHAGRLVTHNELLAAVWPNTFVQPEVLKGQILSIRRALGDDPKHPRFIETQPRRGHEFIAPMRDTSSESTFAVELPYRNLVGRQAELGQLRESLQTALRGQRQVFFVTGEPGIGKTSLVDEFQRQIAADAVGIRITRGQCVEGFGGKEAYYPLLEALGELFRGSERNALVKVLEKQAPTLLGQFPALISREHRQDLKREILGATRERMLREISEALETLASERPLVLVLEDLHWVDPSTVDLISALARRRQPAKLMLIGTYRPTNVAVAEHPLKAVKQDLLVRHLCREVALEPLTEIDVAEYLAAESTGTGVPPGLAGWIYRHTEGNPLFMVAGLDDLRDRDLITVENGTWQIKVPLEKLDLTAPESLRQMIESQIERLSPEEQRVLEVASILRKFSLAVTMGAAVANLEPDKVEELLEGLARRHQIIRRAGFREYRNGLSACYDFLHVLYRQVLYSRIASARRRQLHQSMAEHGEALRLLRGVTMDAELAYQFEEGGDWPRAVKYLVSAADMAGRRFEPQQAIEILEHALELVNNIPESRRAQSEIEVLQKLCTIYSTSFDPRGLQIYETLVARAAHYGLAEVEVHALLEMSFPLALVRADLYMEALDRALQVQLRIGGEDPLQRAAVRALYICRRTGAGKWEPHDMEECRNLIAKLREADDRRYLWEVQLGLGFPLFNFSRYRESQRCAEEGLDLFLKSREENPYPSWHFQLHQELVCSCLVFLGEWGEALRRVDQWIEMSEKNGDRHGTMVARLERLELQIQMLDFTGAQQNLQEALPVVAEMSRVRRYWLIWAGWVEGALGNHERALEYLLRCKEDMDQNPLMSDWYHRVPLQRALTELWLSKGDLEKARVEAELFLKVALATEERTFQALAFEAVARVAIAERNLDRAQDCLAKAQQAMQGYEVPLAHWRVHATEAKLHEIKANSALAEYHLALSRDTIMKLANSLSLHKPLRQIFLSAPMVRNILSDATTAVA